MLDYCSVPVRLPARAAFLALLMLAAATLAVPAQAQSQSLRLTADITGLYNYTGKLVIYLWADTEEKARFPDPARVQKRDERGNDVPCEFPAYDLCRRTVESLQDLKARFVFTGLPPGDYALFVFHDEDNDGIFDTGFLKRPLEGRGFSHVLPEELRTISNQVRFSKARIMLRDNLNITVGLKYPPRW